MGRKLLTAFAAASLGLWPAVALPYDILHPEEVARGLAKAKVKLDDAVFASAAQGRPISAKFEVNDHNAIQLSVYTMAFDDAGREKYIEVIVDDAGDMVEAKAITDPTDLKSASQQSAVMLSSRLDLMELVGEIAEAYPGYVIAGIFPVLKDDVPVVEIHLMKGAAVKKVLLPAG